MKKIVLALIAVFLPISAVQSASIVNKESEAVTLVVTEGTDTSQLLVQPGETVEFCVGGCFVTLPNGDRQALTGAEEIEISGGTALVK